MTNTTKRAGDSVSGTKYLGPVWERCQMKDGSFELMKLHMYWVRGERRFALTEAEALAAVAA